MAEVTKKDCQKNVDIMTDKIDKVKEGINKFELSITTKLSELPKKLADEFDNRYANKRVEKTIDKVVWLIIVAVVISALNIVLK